MNWLQASLASMVDAGAVEQGVQLCRDKAAEQDGLAVVPRLASQAPLPHSHDVHVPLQLRQGTHSIEHCRRQGLGSDRQRRTETGPRHRFLNLHDRK